MEIKLSSNNWPVELSVQVNKEMTLVIGSGEIGKSLKSSIHYY